jgi:hypothetical protein
VATLRLKRFSALKVLQAIDCTRLLTFLRPYCTFFLARGVSLPPPASSNPVPFDQLIDVFMSPDESTPTELVDALYHVDGMATEEGMSALLGAARQSGLPLDEGEDVTPADVAVQVWLHDPNLLERKHAEQHLTNHRSFEYFQTDEDQPPPFQVPSTPTITALEGALNDWFADNRRGRTARVFVFDRPDGPSFLVRHGEPFKREESVIGAEPSSIAYRPLRYDVLTYDPCRGELGIHAQLKGEKKLYCKEFGRHLFGRPNIFPGGIKYTLEPLRRQGELCLACGDVEGLEKVVLRELHYDWGGAQSEYEIVRANNLFAALRERGNRTIPRTPRLARAVFAMKFTGVERFRLVTIKPPNVALYARDEDTTPVEQWLQNRRFLDVYADDDEAVDPILVSA